MADRRDLTLAVAQPATATHDLAGNAGRHADLVRRSGARIVGFPELSLTGYDMAVTAVDPADPRLGPLVRACAETGAIAFAGAPVAADGGGRHIATLLVDGTGARVAYRKRFLGGAEPAAFVPGPEPVVVEVDGWRIGLAICRDTGVARHDHDLATLGIDVYLAGVVEHAADRAVPGDRARRIATDHGVWVAIASCAGGTGAGYDRTAGGSAVRRPDGTVAAAAGTAAGEVVSATVPSR
ncbi:carbon-nitrogen hydrolase family protein [Nakamurella sp.]|uniref:carbon-nitrogen hydrolase family protein n=1 Tax=Nakamurella sp. TaxID=1869182 RepID=UPI003B3ADCEE